MSNSYGESFYMFILLGQFMLLVAENDDSNNNNNNNNNISLRFWVSISVVRKSVSLLSHLLVSRCLVLINFFMFVECVTHSYSMQYGSLHKYAQV